MATGVALTVVGALVGATAIYRVHHGTISSPLGLLAAGGVGLAFWGCILTACTLAFST